MSDAIVFEKNLKDEVQTDPFDSSRWGYIVDSNGGTYSQQVTFDASTISTTEAWLDWRSAVVEIPVTLQATLDMTNSSAALNAAGIKACETLVSLKSGHYNLFNSINVQYDGRSVTQQIENQNFLVNYKLLTQLSKDEEDNLFDMLGMSKDSSESVGYDATIGTYNHSAFSVAPVVGASIDVQNKGLLKRLQQLNKPTIYNTRNALNTAASSNSTHRPIWSQSTINPPTAGSYSFRIDYVATVRLRDFHNIFEQLEMTKGSPVRITFNLNTVPKMVVPAALTIVGGGNPSSTITGWGAPTTNTLMGSTNPIMLSDTRVGQNTIVLDPDTTAASLTCSLGIANSYNAGSHPMMSSCRLYYKSFVMNATYEEMLLNKGRFKDIVYDDVYAYTMDASGTSFNQVIASSVSNLKKVVIMPYLKSGANGNIINYPSFQSPFSPSPATLDPIPIPLTNFQIAIAGKNQYQNTLSYSWEHFNQVFAPSQGLNGDYVNGLSSGLIGKKDWESGVYGYYVTDVQYSPQDFAQGKSVQITGNNITGKNINLFVFAVYERKMTIDILTGKISDRS